jgi:hypothetical protein
MTNASLDRVLRALKFSENRFAVVPEDFSGLLLGSLAIRALLSRRTVSERLLGHCTVVVLGVVDEEIAKCLIATRGIGTLYYTEPLSPIVYGLLRGAPFELRRVLWSGSHLN